jgi:hypothetical protein
LKEGVAAWRDPKYYQFNARLIVIFTKVSNDDCDPMDFLSNLQLVSGASSEDEGSGTEKSHASKSKKKKITSLQHATLLKTACERLRSQNKTRHAKPKETANTNPSPTLRYQNDRNRKNDKNYFMYSSLQ